ncbi:hypothetical protein F9L07_03525 [Pimelobacter simplex]|uniref:PIN domain-containing protein n=1 Tax=Nocardioides simplex TaxID=2045 RepID=A0A7J5DYB5_NOCSI|nr:PIN domain-containing protein [Pimelobacter simplex]KAB2811016.1 hypothetical protein F9L07_03525 [Pimelobacter simplex]
MALRLLPGIRPSDACEALRGVEFAATNVLGSGHTGDAIIYAYLDWALDSVRMLRPKFDANGVDNLILSRRYWHLQTVGHVDLQMASRLVGIEVSERVEALRTEQRRFAAEEKRWQRGRLVVLDTSALIQGPKLWEWDPAITLELRDLPVQLVVPILVMDELDGLKESTKQHTRYRARETLKWIAERLGGSQSALIRNGGIDRTDGQVVRVYGDVHLHVMLDEPGHRRLPIADDEIVDRATEIATVAGRDVTLVTDDVGQAYRARLAGLSVRMLVDPIYDVDVHEAARAAKQLAKDEQRRAGKAMHGHLEEGQLRDVAGGSL